MSGKKVVFGVETDLTGLDGGNVTNNTVKRKLINEYSDIMDFMTIRGSKQGSFVDADTMKITSVELPKLPPELIGTFDEDEWFRVYINGVLIPKAKYNFVHQDNTDEIYFNFSTGSVEGGGSYPDDLVSTTSDLGYILENTDEFGVTGKFKEL